MDAETKLRVRAAVARVDAAQWQLALATAELNAVVDLAGGEIETLPDLGELLHSALGALRRTDRRAPMSQPRTGEE